MNDVIVMALVIILAIGILIDNGNSKYCDEIHAKHYTLKRCGDKE